MWLIFWILVLIFNTSYTFFPSEMQNSKFVRITAIVVAVLILVVSGIKEIQGVKNQRWAIVSAFDGKILKKNNFPWRINKTKDSSGETLFIVFDRYGDASQITLEGLKDGDYKVHNTMTGVGISFNHPESQIKNFQIIIND